MNGIAPTNIASWIISRKPNSSLSNQSFGRHSAEPFIESLPTVVMHRGDFSRTIIRSSDYA